MKQRKRKGNQGRRSSMFFYMFQGFEMLFWSLVIGIVFKGFLNYWAYDSFGIFCLDEKKDHKMKIEFNILIKKVIFTLIEKKIYTK